MSGFDGIFGTNASVQKSSLFKDLKPSSLLGSDSAPSKAAPSTGKDAKHSAANTSLKRAKAPQENHQPAAVATKRPRKKVNSDEPVVPAAAADAGANRPSAASASKAAKRQKTSTDAAASTVNTSHSESAAAKAARAAAEKLVKLGGIDREDLASPPVHETLQRQAVPRKRSMKPKVAAQKQAPVQSQHIERPAERIAAGSAAPAEQPLDAAPNGVEQARPSACCQQHGCERVFRRVNSRAEPCRHAGVFTWCPGLQAVDGSADDKLDRTIFVGNLRAAVKPKAIKQLFAR